MRPLLLLTVLAASPAHADDVADRTRDAIKQYKAAGFKQIECRDSGDMPWKWKYRRYAADRTYVIQIITDSCNPGMKVSMSTYGNGESVKWTTGKNIRVGEGWYAAYPIRYDGWRKLAMYRMNSDTCRRWSKCIFLAPRDLGDFSLTVPD
ncbi:MAG: hypothetical protein KDA24_29080 [Deltaproteobacteria bacterium]|nr:hypothetical protein [Deltaproteobacteria bacterium]